MRRILTEMADNSCAVAASTPFVISGRWISSYEHSTATKKCCSFLGDRHHHPYFDFRQCCGYIRLRPRAYKKPTGTKYCTVGCGFHGEPDDLYPYDVPSRDCWHPECAFNLKCLAYARESSLEAWTWLSVSLFFRESM